jgi:hypothetical protein
MFLIFVMFVAQAHRTAAILLLPQTLLLFAAAALTLGLWHLNRYAVSGTHDTSTPQPAPPQTLPQTPSAPMAAASPSPESPEVLLAKVPGPAPLVETGGTNGTSQTLPRHAGSNGTGTLGVSSASRRTDAASDGASDSPRRLNGTGEPGGIAGGTLRGTPVSNGDAGTASRVQEEAGELVGASAGTNGRAGADHIRRKWRIGAGAGDDACGIGRTTYCPLGVGKCQGPGWNGAAAGNWRFSGRRSGVLPSGGSRALCGVLPPGRGSIHAQGVIRRKLAGQACMSHVRQTLARVLV